ncbi:hypothetical protein [Sporosarcina ureilytica]|uniref:Uncharacterized protein n=1 Tax=Sporosarcina ureilytica TaxID=298596 RepID=A0A1D8JDE6_9BACL|nr:hypothetical protein [Sporosarcina ureilytica]AOV06728.1 hypothetical protein BI350_03385 [Sporosarcina ureilytica]
MFVYIYILLKKIGGEFTVIASGAQQKDNRKRCESDVYGYFLWMAYGEPNIHVNRNKRGYREIHVCLGDWHETDYLQRYTPYGIFGLT